MKEYLGVTHEYILALKPEILRKYLLFFDKIIIVGMGSYYDLDNPLWDRFKYPKWVNKLWNKGIAYNHLIESCPPPAGINFSKEIELTIEDLKAFHLEGQKGKLSSSKARLARIAAAQLNEKGYRAVTISDGIIFSDEQNEGLNSSEISTVCINQIPLPSPLMSLDQIIELREDTELKMKLNKLRRWMKKTATEFTDISELEEEIQWSINDYTEYMNLQKIKYELGTIGTIVTGVIGVLEDLAKFKFKELAKDIFSISKNNVNLMEAELSAPGRELSFFVLANEKLKKLDSCSELHL